MRSFLLYLLWSVTIVAHGRAREMKPEVNFLGIDLRENDRGWKIESLPASASQDSPLAEGDVITKIRGQDVGRAGPLSIAALLNDAQLHNFPVLIERRGQKKEVLLFTPAYSGSVEDSRAQTSSGVTFNLVEDTQRIIITDVVPGSPAEHAGLRKNDELVALDGKGIGALTPAQIAQHLDHSRKQVVHLRIRRDGRERDLLWKRTPSGQTPRVSLDGRGEQAPPFTLQNLVGKDISLRDFQGKPVLLTFWSTWCAPCLAEAGLINNLEKESKPQLAVLALDVDDAPQVVRHFMQARRLVYPVLIAGRSDSPIPKLYGLGALPLTVVINSEGFIVYVQTGFGADSPLESRVHTVMAKAN